MKNRSSVLILLFVVANVTLGQRAYEIHKRGMLHETIFNTGEIGRAYMQGNNGNATIVPLMEWPAHSKVTIDQKDYDGQHNSLGGGVWIGANASDTTARLKALCGGTGAGDPEITSGIYTFPLSVTRRENYPLSANGDLNPMPTVYNPDEAEEIITSRWATTTGVTVTRTSRAWSFPDYDDFIIYEYEFENTGNRDADTTTIESHAALTDVIVCFPYGFAPSMFGYMRQTVNRWYYNEFEANTRGRFDLKRWLDYSLNTNGNPELTYFAQWSPTKQYGGGLLSPQAVGVSMLYYDTTHLARYDETYAYVLAADSLTAWDRATGKLRQPWANYGQTSNFRSTKNLPCLDIGTGRAPESGTNKNLVYKTSSPNRYDGSAYWTGRGSAYKRVQGNGRVFMMGPYTIPYGQKIKIALAEVAGYGAATLQQVRSGKVKDHDTYSDLYCVPPCWFLDTISGTAYMGSTYLQTYPLPDYVNSKVVTVRDVTDRAIHAYNGGSVVNYDSVQYQPEMSVPQGSYRFPIPYPAPMVTFSNTTRAENVLEWGGQVESFTPPIATGSFSHYEVQKANHPLGPWTRLDSVGKADSRFFFNGKYKYIDTATTIGLTFYYSVLSVDNNGNKSGRTNMQLYQTQLGGTDRLAKVTVVPNPYIIRSGFPGTTADGNDASNKIGFYNLPKVCTIRIYSYAGQLIKTLEHNAGVYSAEYLQVTRNNQVMASGVYYFVVQTPDGQMNHGKFVVIH